MNECSIANNLSKQNASAKPVSKWINKRFGVELICFLLLLLFSYAAVSKLIEYNSFVGQLRKSPYLEQYASIVAWLVPVVECIIVLLLLFKKTRLTGLFASFGLMLMFTAYIYTMLNFSFYIPCSCGGILALMSWTQHFWFNVIFTVLALTGVLLMVVRRQ
ncbi:hypothetical protein FAM09_11880 [Niastella caeni]|uniref:Methylamine utilisation protein MauE domain-containing protein n=1 Tax=Niastella caeni TaxID=2569763 RepID=A0A4S8HUD0_9BACT|nr:MauE/DoxX family redox-associated membrane protein [Niastella caeni]THU39207.1 hypothetical protein FAM09_11880 [Niastella caeni]